MLGTCMDTFGKLNVVFRSGVVFRKRLLFSFVIKVWRKGKNCWKVKYFKLKNEYHAMERARTTDKKHVHFSIQRNPFFSIFSFLFKPSEQKETTAFYEILHQFWRLYPPCQKSLCMYLTVCGNKRFLASGFLGYLSHFLNLAGRLVGFVKI